MSENGHVHTELTEDELYAQNCDTVASAIEDLHHRNLARMTILQAAHHVEVNPHDLLAMKFEILLDLLVGENKLLKLQVGFTFQQQLAERLTALEISTKET